jgi:hypothetical protein
MKKNFIVSKIEVPQDGSQYVLVAFTDKNESTYKIKVVKQFHLPLQKT